MALYLLKEYGLYRDKHTYQCPKTKSKTKCIDRRLEIHYIKFRSNGGSDKPSNLITLCEKHHKELHRGIQINHKGRKPSIKKQRYPQMMLFYSMAKSIELKQH